MSFDDYAKHQVALLKILDFGVVCLEAITLSFTVFLAFIRMHDFNQGCTLKDR